MEASARELGVCPCDTYHQRVQLGQRVFNVEYFLIERKDHALDVQCKLCLRNDIGCRCIPSSAYRPLLALTMLTVDAEGTDFPGERAFVRALEILKRTVRVGYKVSRNLQNIC